MLIRSLDPAADLPALLGLWNAALGACWPLPAGRQAAAALVQGEHLLAEEDGQAVGFALTQLRASPSPCGSLLALGVHPAWQRRGIGRALLAAAMNHLAQRGARRVQLGAGAHDYFWPGVPANLPAAWPFFAACGWPEIERSYDVYRTLHDYTTPPGVHERARAARVTLRLARPTDRPAVLALPRDEEPTWPAYYRAAFDQGRLEDILIAELPPDLLAGPGLLAGPDLLVGVCLLEEQTGRWSHLLDTGGRIGAPGALYVSPAQRGRGIGLALAARATELIRDRGLPVSILGYTWLVDWYGQLGYRVWQEYRMSWKDL